MPRHLTGVFIGSHAVAQGLLTADQLRQQSWRRLVHGVYADPALEVDHRLRATAVALLLPAGAVIGGLSAAAWHGAPFAGTNDLVTVLRPPTVEWKGPRGVRTHRTRLSAADVERHDDVPVTSALRTAWDVAALEPLGTAVAALDGMVRAGSVGLPELQAMAERGAGRRGVVRVRRAVPPVDPRAQSPPEPGVRRAVRGAGVTPEPQYEVWLAGRLLGRVDLALAGARVAVEYEGPHHFEDLQIVRDDARLAGLVAAGWRVIRLSAADLRDLDGVVARVRAALAR